MPGAIAARLRVPSADLGAWVALVGASDRALEARGDARGDFDRGALGSHADGANGLARHVPAAAYHRQEPTGVRAGVRTPADLVGDEVVAAWSPSSRSLGTRLVWIALAAGGLRIVANLPGLALGARAFPLQQAGDQFLGGVVSQEPLGEAAGPFVGLVRAEVLEEALPETLIRGNEDLFGRWDGQKPRFDPRASE